MIDIYRYIFIYISLLCWAALKIGQDIIYKLGVCGNFYSLNLPTFSLYPNHL